jgi:predicted dehydrogenase
VFAALPERFRIMGGFDVEGSAIASSCELRLASEAEALAAADVVVIATPTETHKACAVRALTAGRSVLIEKPLCACAVDAALVADLSALGPARLFVGQSERFNPVVRVLARLLREDPPVAIDLRRVGPAHPAEIGALLNMGVHDFDLAAYLAGADVRVRSVVARSATGSTVEELAHVLFTTATGAAGHLYVDRTHVAKSRAVTLTTARWIYEGDLLAHRLWRTPRLAGERCEVPLPAEEPLLAQALALADVLDGRSSRELATAHDGARAVVLAEEAARSWVDAGAAGGPDRKAEAGIFGQACIRPRRPT